MSEPLTLMDDPLASSREALAQLLSQHRSGYSLEQPLYNDERVLQHDLENIFEKEWLIAGMGSEVPDKGNYLKVEIGDNSVIVVRGADQTLHAFHNVCRHRGSRLCLNERGKVAKLVCPYHQWTYELDGRLLFAGTEMRDDFNMAEYGLKPVHVREAGGFIFISLAERPVDLEPFFKTVEFYMKPYDMANTKVACQSEIIEAANWKLVIENNRECYHCEGSHPELLNTLLEWDDVTDPRASEEFKQYVAACATRWEADQIPYHHVNFGARNRLVRMPLIEGALSMTADGGLACQKLLGRVRDPDLGSMRILHLPHSWNHCMGDHIINFTVWPISAQKTKVITKWIVHKDAQEGVDYDVDRLRFIWDATNDQDRRLAEENQRGINSMAYQPGPYSPTYEFGVIDFVNWYVERMLTSLKGENAPQLTQVAG